MRDRKAEPGRADAERGNLWRKRLGMVDDRRLQFAAA